MQYFRFGRRMPSSRTHDFIFFSSPIRTGAHDPFLAGHQDRFQGMAILGGPHGQALFSPGAFDPINDFSNPDTSSKPLSPYLWEYRKPISFKVNDLGFSSLYETFPFYTFFFEKMSQARRPEGRNVSIQSNQKLSSRGERPREDSNSTKPFPLDEHQCMNPR
jgi:hypothetical protein